MSLVKYSVLTKDYRAAIFNGDLIVLAISENRFYLMASANENVILDLANGIISPASDPELFDQLDELGAIARSNRKMKPIRDKTKSNSFFDTRWSPSEARASASGIADRVNVITCLILSGLIVKFGSFKTISIIVRMIRKLHKGVYTSEFRIKNDINKCSYNLNKYFWIDISGNKCLTYCLAQMLILRKHASQLSIVIGVRTRPFCSHAWIEHSGKPITEEAAISDKLSVLLVI